MDELRTHVENIQFQERRGGLKDIDVSVPPPPPPPSPRHIMRRSAAKMTHPLFNSAPAVLETWREINAQVDELECKCE